MGLEVRPPAWGSGGLDVPAEFAAVHSLGPAAVVHRPSRNPMRVPAVIGIVGAALLVTGSVLVLVGTPAAIPALLIGAIFGPLGLWNVLRLRGTARCLVVYRDGFAALVGKTVSVWPWRDIAAITTKERWVRGSRSGYHERRYDISKASGETVIVEREYFEDVTSIVESIQSHSTAKLLPGLQAAYDAGRSLPFGAVVVSQEEIQIEGRTLPWTNVSGAVVKDGRLIVMPRSGSPIKVSVWKIPNIELLGALIGIRRAEMDLMYS